MDTNLEMLTGLDQKLEIQPVASLPSSSIAGSGKMANEVPVVAPAAPEALDVSDYLDYRKFLEDFYAFKKHQTRKDIRPYNYSIFAAAADIKSPNYLKMIIEGKRNLSEDMIGKFAKALSLNKEQAEDFRLLVLYSQTTEPSSRNLFLNKLNAHRVQSKIRSGEMDKKAFDKVPNWVSWVLYTMIDQGNVEFKPERLFTLLRKKASVDEIETALKALINSGEVVVNDVTGKLEKSHTLMQSADEVPVALVRKLQTELMFLGLESLFQDEPTDREFGTATMSMTKAEFEELKFQLRKIRKQAQKDNAVKRSVSKGDRVYQLNLQLYPISEDTSADKNSSI